MHPPDAYWLVFVCLCLLLFLFCLIVCLFVVCLFVCLLFIDDMYAFGFAVWEVAKTLFVCWFACLFVCLGVGQKDSGHREGSNNWNVNQNYHSSEYQAHLIVLIKRLLSAKTTSFPSMMSFHPTQALKTCIRFQKIWSKYWQTDFVSIFRSFTSMFSQQLRH